MQKISISNIIKRTLRWVGNSIVLLILLLLAVFISLQFSLVQTFIAQKALAWLSPKMQFDLSLSELYFDAVNAELSIKNLQVKDRKKNKMLDIAEVRIDIEYENLLKNGNVAIKNIRLKRGVLNLIADEKTGLINIVDFIDVIDSLTAPKVRNPNAPPTIVDITQAKLIDVRFTYTDARETPRKDKGLDYFHLKINELNAELDNFHLAGDTIQMQLKDMRGIDEKTDMQVKNLTTFFRMTRKSMEFHQLNCLVNHSTLKDKIFLSFDKQKDLSRFNEKVFISAKLDSTILHTEDLALFAPAIERYKDIWTLSGQFEGKVNDFIFKNFDGYIGKNTHLKGLISMKGLPDVKNTLMNFEIPMSDIDFPELFQYIEQPLAEPYLKSLGRVQFVGNYIGTIDDFKTKGNLSTKLGNLQADIHLKPSLEYYDATLNTSNFELGKLLQQDKTLGIIDLNGKIKGVGFSMDKVKLATDMKINRIRLLDYTYQNLRIDGDLSQKSFKGEFISKDKNFEIDLNGNIDLFQDKKERNHPPGRIKFDTDLKHIDLKKLGFLPEETILKGKMKVDLYGMNPDSLIGTAELDSAFVLYKQKGLVLNKLNFLSFKDREKGSRLLDLQSDYADLHLEGKFLFSDLLDDLQKLIHEYALSFKNEPKSIKKYYTEKNKKTLKTKYGIEFNANFKDANPLIALFDTKLFLSKNTLIEGKFGAGKTTLLNLSTSQKIDSLFYGNNKLYDIGIDINTSKLAEKPEILAESSITSARQKINGINTKNLLATAVWGDNLIDFGLKTEQIGTTNLVDLAGDIKFKEDTTLIAFKSSRLHLLEKNWLLSKDNLISLVPKGILIQNLQLYKQENPESQIKANGEISNRLEQPLQVKIQDFDLLAFANIIGFDIKGTLNSELSMKNLQDNPEIKGSLNIENVMLGDMLIGDTEGKLDWDDKNQVFTFNNQLYRMGRFILDIDGTYKPKEKNNPLKALIDFRRTDIVMLEPFTKGLISKLRGTAEGQLELTGSLSELHILGDLKIENAKLRLDYLNTFYNADIIKVNFTHNEIKIKDANIFDHKDHPARLNMSVFHDNFKDFYLESKTYIYDNFQFMNTSIKDNSVFYGEAYGKGTVAINGFLNNLVMDITVKTQSGTKIIMPMDGFAEVTDQNYVQFVQKEVKKDTLVKKINLGGMKLNFNLDVTNDAEFEIVFDKKAGDVLQAVGRGNIEMKIDTQGDFGMFGTYIIDKGKYSVTLFNFISKVFAIRQGGTINFNGDLYNSQLDVNAAYQRNVSMRPLFEAELPDVPREEQARAYPVAAVMNLKGSLFAPDIKLNLDVNDAKRAIPNATIRSSVMQLETRLLTDEQERNKQVFSLLMIGQLAPRSEFSGVGTAGISSVSEFITNQLSNWFSQIDPNLQVNLNIDPANVGMSQVRVSYNWLDGRIRITRDGGFVNTRNQADFASVIGDWTLEYLLGNTGRYRLKMYNRTNQTIANGLNLNSQTAMSAGVSFVQTASFDGISELFKSKKQRDAEAKQIEEDQKKIVEDFKGDDISKINKPIKIEKKEIFPLKHRTDNYAPEENKIVENPKNNHKNNGKDNEEDDEEQQKPKKEKEKPKNAVFPRPHKFDEKIKS
ncbi:MAG: hypothetical protein EAZ85_12020 [Bacteroidetes bacterium]|nr:MAG: hypothetical protein EAZ85_12020 [Bacteroidota bacterium]TAG94478.1 MAG: hypothetical protein EAZ20_00870 [Bacteroidota bacterium]